MTDKNSFAEMDRKGDGHFSQLHITFRAARSANFHIGNFPSQRDCPGIPLDPKTLAARETLHVNWVELEFKNNNGMHPESPLYSFQEVGLLTCHLML